MDEHPDILEEKKPTVAWLWTKPGHPNMVTLYGPGEYDINWHKLGFEAHELILRD